MNQAPGPSTSRSPSTPPSLSSSPIVAGVLLAAGAGRRMGGPKALLRGPDGTAWVTRAAQVLADGGCRPVLVVVGAAADRVAGLLPPSARAVTAEDWADGMGASLRAGLAELRVTGAEAADAVLIGLVDTPGVTAAVVARLLAVAGPDVLARASYGGRPGHPVLIGRRHWAGVARGARGDAGARGYLAGRDDVRLVECGDLGSGEDLDLPGDVTDLSGDDLPGNLRHDLPRDLPGDLVPDLPATSGPREGGDPA